jgi:hypothetical protein
MPPKPDSTLGWFGQEALTAWRFSGCSGVATGAQCTVCKEATMTRSERERFLQALLYFSRATTRLWAKKAFKLLYLLDVLHFQETGRTATGCQYSAHGMGPCADELAIELWSPKPDLTELFDVTLTITAGKEEHMIAPKPAAKFNDDVLSTRHMRLLTKVADQYKDAEHAQIDVTAVDNGAWRAALSARKGYLIDLGEALSDQDPHRDHKLTVASDYERRMAYLRALA